MICNVKIASFSLLQRQRYIIKSVNATFSQVVFAIFRESFRRPFYLSRFLLYVLLLGKFKKFILLDKILNTFFNVVVMFAHVLVRKSHFAGRKLQNRRQIRFASRLIREEGNNLRINKIHHYPMKEKLPI